MGDPDQAPGTSSAAEQAPRRCGNSSCSNVEQKFGQYAKCARCKATVYCSRECQVADHLTGHALCTLAGLVDSTKGGWSDAHFKKAARLLSNNPEGPHLHPILGALQSGLLQANASATFPAPPVNLVNAHPQLLSALVKAYDAVGKGQRTQHAYLDITADQTLRVHHVDAVAATVLLLLGPSIRQLLLEPTNTSAAMALLSAYSAVVQSSSGWALLKDAYRPMYAAAHAVQLHHGTTEPSQQHAAGFVPLPHPDPLVYGEHWTSAWGLPVGQTACLLADTLSMLLQLAGDKGVFAGQQLPQQRASACSKLRASRPDFEALVDLSRAVWHYEAFAQLQTRAPIQYEMMLPSVTIGALRWSHGNVCQPLLTAPETARPLLHSLQRLQQLPSHRLVSDEWQLAQLCGELMAVQEWGQWMASRQGLAGLEVLAGLFMEPVLALTDKLLSATGFRCSRDAAVHLQSTALKALAHLAPTNTGRKQLADAKFISRWAELMQTQLQIPVQLLVALVIFSSCNDWLSSEQPYWCRLYPRDRDAEPDAVKLPVAPQSGIRPWVPDAAVLDSLLQELGGVKVQGALRTLHKRVGNPPAKRRLEDCMFLGIQNLQHELTPEEHDFFVQLVAAPASSPKAPDPLPSLAMGSQGVVYYQYHWPFCDQALQKLARCCIGQPGAAGRLQRELPGHIANWLAKLAPFMRPSRMARETQERASAYIGLALDLLGTLRVLLSAPHVLPARTAMDEMQLPGLLMGLLQTAGPDTPPAAAACIAALASACSTDADRVTFAAEVARRPVLEQLLASCVAVPDTEGRSKQPEWLHQLPAKQLAAMAAKQQLEASRHLLTVLGTVTARLDARQRAPHLQLLSHQHLWKLVRALLASSLEDSSEWATPLGALLQYLSSVEKLPVGASLKPEIRQARQASVGGVAELNTAMQRLGLGAPDDRGRPGDATTTSSDGAVAQPGSSGAPAAAARAVGPSTTGALASSSRASVGGTPVQAAAADSSSCRGGPSDSAGVDPARVCVVCGPQDKQAHLCGGCKGVRYCSAVCQKAHWKQHKAACKAAQAAGQ